MRYSFEQLADMPVWASRLLRELGDLIFDPTACFAFDSCPYGNHEWHA